VTATATRHQALDLGLQDVQVGAYTVPTDAPEADGTLAWDSTTLVLVQLRAGDTVGTGWTYGPASCVDVVTRGLAPVVRGRDALDVAAGYLAMTAAVRNDGRPGLASLSISAVETAWWDLKARLLGLPLHRLLGAVRQQVPVYGSGGFTTYDDEQLAAQLEGWVSGGIPRVKIKIGEDHGRRVDRDVARIRQAREVIGAGTELYVDANGGYDAKQAVRVLDRVCDQDVRWFEEPVSSDDLAGLRRVRDAVPADVTAGEYGYALDYFAAMLDAQAVDYLQFDVSRCGGFTEWLRVAAVAAAHHVDVSGHCAPHLHLAVAAATPNLRHLEWFHDHVRIEQLLFDGAQAADGGVLQPLDAPGHGLEWRASDASRYRVA
jgi:L-alanine-DL-glutamate epimerase-like enolase superfamily enzyme